MKMTMRFEGGRELAAALASLKPRVSKSIQREVLRDVAEPMRAQMARLAPRRAPAPDMADNMVISNMTKRDGIIDSQMVGVKVGPARGFIYAFFQEFGTVHHGPQPFARPAFDSEAPKALREIAKRLWVELAGRGISRTGASSGPVSGGEGGSTL